jgi:hypothetical protein
VWKQQSSHGWNVWSFVEDDIILDGGGALNTKTTYSAFEDDIFSLRRRHIQLQKITSVLLNTIYCRKTIWWTQHWRRDPSSSEIIDGGYGLGSRTILVDNTQGWLCVCVVESWNHHQRYLKGSYSCVRSASSEINHRNSEEF